MITEKEKYQNNGEIPLLAFILQVGLGLYLCRCMSLFEGEGKEFHSMAKEVFGKVIKLDDFLCSCPKY